MNLLIVDDDNATLESVKLCFEIFDPETKLDTAVCGIESLELLKNNSYDCAIIDLGLPDMDGLQLIEYIRSFSQIPLMVLSARQSAHVVASAFEKGANEYMCKPFDYRDLLAKLKTLVGTSS